eukprot:9157062-Alexandrium_andersonii.AAC.1
MVPASGRGQGAAAAWGGVHPCLSCLGAGWVACALVSLTWPSQSWLARQAVWPPGLGLGGFLGVTGCQG